MSDMIARGMAANAMSSGGGGGGGTTVDAYSKNETDNLLRGKANASDVYTSQQTDALLDDKVNKVSGKGLSTNDYTNEDMSLVKTISNKANTNDVNASITNLQNQISETSENVDTINTELMTNAGYSLGMSINPTTFELTMTLKNSTGGTVSSQKVDLPIESMVVSASYANGKLSLKLQNGQTLDTDISAIVAGLVNQNFTIAGIDMKDNIEANELKTALGINTITSDVSTLKNDMSTAKTNISTIQSDISGLKTRDSELQSDIDENTTAIEQIESDILSLYKNSHNRGIASAKNNPNKWYKIGEYTANVTLNTTLLITSRYLDIQGLLTLTANISSTSSGIVWGSTALKTNWLGLRTITDNRSKYNIADIFKFGGTLTNGILHCELWVKIPTSWDIFSTVILYPNQNSSYPWEILNSDTAFDNYPEFEKISSPTDMLFDFETRLKALETAQTTTVSE